MNLGLTMTSTLLR